MARRWWVCVIVGLQTASAYAGDPLDQPAFTAAPAELLAAARAVPAGDAGAFVLREDFDVALDRQGRQTRRWRYVFVIRSQDVVDDWRTLSTSWSPSYQDRPAIRARVITPDGRELALDPAKATERTRPDHERHQLEVALPGLEAGAIVEQEIVTRDRRPRLAAGIAGRVPLGSTVPTRHTTIAIAAPVGRPLRRLARNLPPGVTPRHARAAGRDVWRYDVGPLPANPPSEPFSLRPRAPEIRFATAASWTAVARGYRRIVDERIAAGPVTWPAELARARTVDALRGATRWLHRHVRFSGAYFDESPIVPATPADTLRRGAGDQLAKATALVALLRAGGWRAELALVRYGAGADVDRGLPGMGRFDHVLVRARAGRRAVWIDPVEELRRAGALPALAQGRLALVIAGDTRGLVETPASSAADNVVREVRTYTASELGAATRVTEVTRSTGAYEAGDRAWIRDAAADKLRDHLTRYVAGTYRAAALDAITTTPVDDLAVPFAVTIVASRASIAWTDYDKITVALAPGDVLAHVPDLFDDPLDPPRRTGFVWATPHRYEIEHRIVVPDGYALPAPAPARTRKLGAATFTERQRVDGRTLVVSFALDTGKRTLTAAELTATHAALAALRDERRELTFASTAFQLASAGRLRDALAEADRLIRLHPAEAVHHLVRAQVLIYAGVGGAARRDARRAVELEPTNADAFVTLGWVLRRDSFGREYGFDHDRAGAIAAYRKALALSPKHQGAAVELAQLLERDAHGRRLGPGVDLAAAVAAWRAAVALDPSDDHRAHLLRVLLHAGQFAELERCARAMPARGDRDAYLIAALVAGKGGVPAALAAATGAHRGASLDRALRMLLASRWYGPARALAPHAPLGAEPTLQTMVSKLARLPEARSPLDARTAILETRRVANDPTYHSKAALTRYPFARARTRAADDTDLTAMSEDMLWSAATLQLEGGPRGPWRGHLDLAGVRQTWYFAREGGIVRAIGVDDELVGLGVHALKLLRAGDAAGARQLLAWARQAIGAQNGPWARAFIALWDAPRRDDGAVALAAAMLAAVGDPAHAIPHLERCASRLPAVHHRGCDQMLRAALAKARRWPALEAHLRAQLARTPGDLDKREQLARALFAQRRFGDTGRELDAILARDPSHHGALHLRTQLAAARGDLGTAIATADALLQRPDPSEYELNEAAWLRVVAGRELALALDQARRAVGRDRAKASPNALNTLAVIELEQGDLVAARRDQLQADDNDRRTQPAHDDWYVFGRIAEQLGLRADAIAAYRHVRPRVNPLPGVDTTVELAQRRLAVLAP